MKPSVPALISAVSSHEISPLSRPIDARPIMRSAARNTRPPRATVQVLKRQICASAPSHFGNSRHAETVQHGAEGEQDGGVAET